jgi:hypothetical protein
MRFGSAISVAEKTRLQYWGSNSVTIALIEGSSGKIQDWYGTEARSPTSKDDRCLRNVSYP